MKLYSDFAPQRTRQIVGDAIAILLIACWIVVGLLLYGVVAAFHTIGSGLAEAGDGFAGWAGSTTEQLAAIPIVGEAISSSFAGATDVGHSIGDVGRSIETTIYGAATAIGLIAAIVPILVVLLVWLLPRLRRAARSGRAAALAREGAALDLLALRALTSTPFERIEGVVANAAGLWREGDPAAVHALAAYELRKLGVRLA